MDECLHLLNIALQDDVREQSPPLVKSQPLKIQDAQLREEQSSSPPEMLVVNGETSSHLSSTATLVESVAQIKEISKDPSYSIDPVTSETFIENGELPTNHLSPTGISLQKPVAQEILAVNSKPPSKKPSSPMMDPVTPETLVDCLCDREVLTRVIQLLKECRSR